MSVALFADFANRLLAEIIWFGGGLALHSVVYFGAAVAIGAVWCLQGIQRLKGRPTAKRVGMDQSVFSSSAAAFA